MNGGSRLPGDWERRAPGGGDGPPRPPAPRLLDRLAQAVRVRHYSPRTEDAYRHWVRRFILFHGKRHPSGLAAPEIAAFLNHLAVEEHVSASTQNQALSAIVFLYRHVLEQEAPRLEDLVRARKPRRLPVVLTASEVRAVLERLEGRVRLIASLLYGSGLRLLECLDLRVKDIDFERLEIRVRDGKGRQDRVTLLPLALVEPLRAQLASARAIHARDRALGFGETALPSALARKYPGAGREWSWQYVLPATSRFTRTGRTGRSAAITSTRRPCSAT